MVAGRSLWGEDEQEASHHQARGGGQLGVEALVEDGAGAGEARGLRPGVEAGPHVDGEDHGEAERPEDEDDPAERSTAAVAHNDRCQRCGQQGDGDQQEGVCVEGSLDADGGGAGPRQPGVGVAPDLNPPVVDELGGDQAGGGGEDHDAGPALGREHGAAPGRRPHGPGHRAPHPVLEGPQEAKEKGAEGP
jgi:hypothetical protein